MRKGIIRILSILTAFSIVILSGCSSKTSDKTVSVNDNKITVYTSFYAMYDFANKIGGDKINLINLVPSGTEPHDWEPSPSDIVDLEKADVLVYNGAGMEMWIDKILNNLKNEKLIAVEASKDLKLLEGADDHDEEEEEGEEDHDLKYDPHVWLNPMNAKKQIEVIKNALSEADPLNKEYFEKNYEDNALKLDELDKEFKDAVEKFTNKNIVVAHQAYGYICDAYGLSQVAIEGLNADSEPSPARMAEITEFAKANNVKYIFFEELISPKIAETIAREIGAQTAVLSPYEGLEEEDIKAGKEYFSVMRENLEALKMALQ